MSRENCFSCGDPMRGACNNTGCPEGPVARATCRGLTFKEPDPLVVIAIGNAKAPAAAHLECTGQSVTNDAVPVYWEYRHTSKDGVVGDWVKVEALQRNLTVEDALAELRRYIADGYAYELRALYATPPEAATAEAAGKAPASVPSYHRETAADMREWLEQIESGGDDVAIKQAIDRLRALEAEETLAVMAARRICVEPTYEEAGWEARIYEDDETCENRVGHGDTVRAAVLDAIKNHPVAALAAQPRSMT